MLKQSLFVTFALIQSLALGGAALAADEVGTVSAVGGEATAQQPGAEPRPLACGDPVFAGDTLRTGSDSHVGVQLDDVATHLDANTQVVIGRTAENTPSARLLSGKVRMIDPRTEGAPAQLAALDADARVKGNDAEAYIFSEKVGPYAMMCEWDSPLPVSRGAESKVADPGDCVIAKPKEPLYTANAHDQRIPALAQECAPGPEFASLNDPRHHLSPTDVAAMGPLAAAFAPPTPAPGPEYTCDQAGVCSPVRPLEVVETDPVVEPDPCELGLCPPANEPPEDGGNEPAANEPPVTAGGPPPFSDEFPGNSGNTPPPFSNEHPGDSGTTPPPFTNEFPGNGQSTPPVNPPPANEPPVVEPPVTAGGPPPFSDEFPGNSGNTPPPFSNEHPGDSGTTPPPFTNEFPGNGHSTPPVNPPPVIEPPVIEPPVTTAGFGPPPFSNIFPGNSATPPAPFTDVPPAPPVADVPPFTNVFPAQGPNAPFTDGFPAHAPNHQPGA